MFAEQKIPTRETPAPEMLVNKDKKFPKNIQLKIEEINNLKPTGNIGNDVNNFLKITGRIIFREISPDRNLYSIFKTLNAIKTACDGILKTKGKISADSKAIKDAEIKAIERLIDYYSKKFPEKKKK